MHISRLRHSRGSRSWYALIPTWYQLLTKHFAYSHTHYDSRISCTVPTPSLSHDSLCSVNETFHTEAPLWSTHFPSKATLFLQPHFHFHFSRSISPVGRTNKYLVTPALTLNKQCILNNSGIVCHKHFSDTIRLYEGGGKQLSSHTHGRQCTWCGSYNFAPFATGNVGRGVLLISKRSLKLPKRTNGPH